MIQAWGCRIIIIDSSLTFHSFLVNHKKIKYSPLSVFNPGIGHRILQAADHSRPDNVWMVL